MASLEQNVNDGIEGMLKEKTELGEVFDNLDNDRVDEQTKFSKIDFNSRLSHADINNCMVFDELKALGIMPENAQISTQKKRLSVSLKGLGRAEKVQIASASRDADLANKGGGFFSKLMGAFKPQE